MFSDTKADAVEYIEKRRTILPPVYNPKQSEGRTTHQTKLLSQKEFNVALGSGYTAMNSRFVIKTEKFCEEITELRNRIVNYNVGVADDGLDDSDIEFLQDEIDEASDSDAEFEAIIPRSVIEMAIKEEVLNESTESQTVQEADSTGNATIGEQQDDVLYGALKCTVNEVNDEYFSDFDVSIRAPIAKFLRAWNTTHPFNSSFYDARFLGVLLREVFGSGFADERLEAMKMNFMKCLFEIRVKGDEDRLKKFDAIVEEKCRKSKDRRASSDK